MASRRVKLAALLGTFALVASACTTTGGSPAPSGGTADRMRRHGHRPRRPRRRAPDPRHRGGQVQRRHGPHRAARRRAAGARPTTRASSTSARTCPTPTSPTSSSCRKGPPPSRSSGAWPARASTSSSAPASATWTPWARSPRSSPTQTFLHLTGYKSNGKNFGNFFGAMEDFKYLAGMLAGSRAKKDGNPKIGYMATFPIPEEVRLGNAIMLGAKQTCPECTMDIRWIGTWHDPIKEKEAAASLFDAGAQVVFTGADTPAVADVAAGEGQVGRDLRPPGLLQDRRLPDGAVLDLGPRVQAHRRAGASDGTYKAGYEYFDADTGGHGPLRLHGWRDAAAGHRRPAGRGCAAGQGHAGQDAGRRVRPLRRLRGPDQRQHRARRSSPRARSSSRPTSTSSRNAAGDNCKTCMNWLVEGINGDDCPQ